MSSKLLDLLNREYAATGAFVTLLDQEAAAMTQGEFARLPDIAARKSTLADQIALMAKQREMEQLSLGHAAGRRGADAAAAAGGDALQHAWRNLLKRAAQAHTSNHRNGVMIHTHLDFTRQTLGFLQAGSQPLYGPDGGHKTGQGGGHCLALG
ncbi:MAG: flagellar protein FlgN [Rhodoferax sp.]|uniref:flagella synthesis protein FlgN n=1 Tax=Rhodoferax sp. TaxID=50421 RepID=UPI002736F2EF|nr:flagellar protein FlgN [Rhodoferax sp.]MDP3864862.1 flagellar protein FlgN [Rhodoferax sp.]